MCTYIAPNLLLPKTLTICMCNISSVLLTGLKESTEEIIKKKKQKKTETVWEQYLEKKKEKKKLKRTDKKAQVEEKVRKA